MLTSSAMRQSLQQCAQLLCEHCGGSPTSLAEAESAVTKIVEALAPFMLEQLLQPSTGRHTYQGTALACPCGEQARFVGYRKRVLLGLWGSVRVQRAYYHCAHCHTGQLPWDQKQGLDASDFTPALKAQVAEVMAHLPYRSGVSLLERLRGVHLPPSSAEQIVLEVGGRLQQEDQQQASACQQWAQAALAYQWGVSETPPPVPVGAYRARHGVCGKRLYISLDGAMAHLDGDWHEVKCGLVYTVDKNATAQDTLLERAYTAAAQSAEEFGWQLAALAQAWQADVYAELIAIGDGAKSNWSVFAKHFPRALQILDFLHASQHLFAAAEAVFGKGNEVARTWWQSWSQTLKEQGPFPVLAELATLQAPTAQAQEDLERERAYLQSNALRMDYPGYRARGLMIGSGPVEAACKVIVGQRLKQAGMRWSRAGAGAVLALRTRVLSGEYETIQKVARAA